MVKLGEQAIAVARERTVGKLGSQVGAKPTRAAVERRAKAIKEARAEAERKNKELAETSKKLSGKSLSEYKAAYQKLPSWQKKYFESPEKRLQAQKAEGERQKAELQKQIDYWKGVERRKSEEMRTASSEKRRELEQGIYEAHLKVAGLTSAKQYATGEYSMASILDVGYSGAEARLKRYAAKKEAKPVYTAYEDIKTGERISARESPGEGWKKIYIHPSGKPLSPSEQAKLSLKYGEVRIKGEAAPSYITTTPFGTGYFDITKPGGMEAYGKAYQKQREILESLPEIKKTRWEEIGGRITQTPFFVGYEKVSDAVSGFVGAEVSEFMKKPAVTFHPFGFPVPGIKPIAEITPTQIIQTTSFGLKEGKKAYLKGEEAAGKVDILFEKTKSEFLKTPEVPPVGIGFLGIGGAARIFKEAKPRIKKGIPLLQEEIVGRVKPEYEKATQELFEIRYLEEYGPSGLTMEKAQERFAETPEYKEITKRYGEAIEAETTWEEKFTMLGGKAFVKFAPETRTQFIGRTALVGGAIVGGAKAFTFGAKAFTALPKAASTAWETHLALTETPKLFKPTLPKEQRFVSGIVGGLGTVSLGIKAGRATSGFAARFRTPTKLEISPQLGAKRAGFVRERVTGLVYSKEGRLLTHYDPLSRKYIFPGGGLKKGRGAMKQMIAEIRQETGLKLTPKQVKFVGTELLEQKHRVFAIQLDKSFKQLKLAPQARYAHEVGGYKWLKAAKYKAPTAKYPTGKKFDISVGYLGEKYGPSGLKVSKLLGKYKPVKIESVSKEKYISSFKKSPIKVSEVKEIIKRTEFSKKAEEFISKQYGKEFLKYYKGREALKEYLLFKKGLPYGEPHIEIKSKWGPIRIMGPSRYDVPGKQVLKYKGEQIYIHGAPKQIGGLPKFKEGEIIKQTKLKLAKRGGPLVTGKPTALYLQPPEYPGGPPVVSANYLGIGRGGWFKFHKLPKEARWEFISRKPTIHIIKTKEALPTMKALKGTELEYGLPPSKRIYTLGVKQVAAVKGRATKIMKYNILEEEAFKKLPITKRVTIQLKGAISKVGYKTPEYYRKYPISPYGPAGTLTKFIPSEEKRMLEVKPTIFKYERKIEKYKLPYVSGYKPVPYKPYKPYKPTPYKPVPYKPYKPYKPTPYKPVPYKPYKPYKPTPYKPVPFMLPQIRGVRRKRKPRKRKPIKVFRKPSLVALGLSIKAPKAAKREATGLTIRPIIIPKIIKRKKKRTTKTKRKKRRK